MRKSKRGVDQAIASAALADRGAEAMRLGRFKIAIDVYKQLIRQDPQPRWHEQLASAYVCRARDLADKGLFKDAVIVLQNTKTAAGRLRDPALYLHCLIGQGQHQKAAVIASQYGARAMTEAGPLGEIVAALCLITPIPAQADSGWVALVGAARAAWDAWLRGEPAADVEALLTRIPLRSPFGPLRLILKSLLLPAEARASAIGLLERISSNSVFGAVASAVVSALIDDKEALLARSGDLGAAQLGFIAAIRGMPEGASALLGQILAAERAGPAALFALLVRPGLAVPSERLRAACLDLLALVPGSIPSFEARFSALSPFERSRAEALAAEAAERWDLAQRHWEAVVDSLAGSDGSEARLAQGVVLRHLADLARRERGIEVAASDDAVAHYLERSVAADPDNVAVTLSLIEHYRETGEERSFQRLAEEAAMRAPANSAILLHAVDGAVARKSYTKAAKFARQLLQRDPINQPVRQRMIELKLAQARKQMRGERADLAAKALSQATEWERADAPSPALRIARALVGYGEGDRRARLALEQAVAHAGGGTVGWFRAELEAALMGWTSARCQPLHRALAATLPTAPGPEAILSLIGLLGQREVRESRRIVASLLGRIDQWLFRGAGLDWSDAEFEAIAACLHDLEAFRIMGDYARARLQRDPGAPVGRFYRIVAETRGESDRLSEGQMREVLDLLDDAEERHDARLAARIRRVFDGGIETRGAVDRHGFLELGAAIADGLPEKELRQMVQEFGRGQAIEILAALVGESPFGEVLSEAEIVLFCGALVTQAVGGGARRASPR